MRKRIQIVSMILVIVFAFSFSACSSKTISDVFHFVFPAKGIEEDTSLGYDEVSPDMFVFSSYYSPSLERLAYNCLEKDGMKALYDMLYQNVHFIYPKAEDAVNNGYKYYKTKQVILEDYVLSEADVRVVIQALTDDNPQIFWTTQTFGYLTETDRNYTAVQLYSSLTANEVTDKLDKIVSVSNQFFSEIPEELNNYQLEKYVHDYIIDNCEYDKETANDDSSLRINSSAFNLYGTLVEKRAVCEGYARTFNFLVTHLGIKCMDIFGISEGEAHMWNTVSLGGDWYYVDVTWDDNDYEEMKYAYFNVNDNVIRKDHEFSKLFSEMTDDEINGGTDSKAQMMNIFIPKCDQTAYNYYVRTLAHMEDYDGESVITAMLVAAGDKDEYFQFYIDPAYLDFSEAIDRLFDENDPLLGTFIEKVNGMLTDYQIDISNVKYKTDESRNIVTLYFSYV